MAKKRLRILTETDKTSIDADISKKVDKVSGKQLSTNDFTNAHKTKLDTTLPAEIDKKVDKVEGKGLSTNDFTDIQKNKVDTEFPASIKKLQEDVAAAGKVDTVNSVKPDNKKNIELTGSNIKYKTGASENIGVKIDILNKGIGDLSQLKTGYKTDLVGAINEIVDTNHHMVYGVEVDETNLNPETAVTYIGDAVGMTPAKNGSYGSWEKWLKDISYRVIVKNGNEQYQLDYDDPRKTISGESANLTGADGDVFTKFKHIYRKFEKTNKGYKLYISDVPFNGSISYTQMLEDGYNQMTNASMIMLQDLYLITHKDRDSQTALGRGYVDVTSDDPFANTGGTNGKGYIYGEATGKQRMCFLGIEDMWGNKYQWVDGLVSDSSYNLLIGYKDFNDSGNSYKKITTNVSSSMSGYAKTVQGGETGYVLADKDASSSTGYCDYGDLNSGRVAIFGGYRSGGSAAGAFRVRLYYSASFSYASIGSRLCFKNENGVYIGNYLGYEQSGKLRSVAGKEPTGSKTIGAFRTLAQANN